MIPIHQVFLAVSIAAAASQEPSSPSALCATPDIAARVVERYGKPGAGLPYALAAELKVSEAAIASALPKALAVGTDGAAFHRIWASLQEWDDAVTMVMKGGNVIEIPGRIRSGTPSKTSQFFNLANEGHGSFTGHLRPDLIAGIYAIDIESRGGALRGVLFYDTKGESPFGVFLPGEGAPVSEGLVAKFKLTRDLVASLPRTCPAR